MLAAALALLSSLSAFLLAWQWIAARRFPLNRRTPPLPDLPSISILKPVTGADAGTAEALASWLAQAYPGTLEVLFGVRSVEDPAYPLVRQLLQQYPDAPARLILCPVHTALNPKVGKLIHLAQEATGRILVVSDADVVAPRDLLAQAVPALRDPAVGLVHCLYRLTAAPTPATRWESFIVNADFWSQVLQDQTLRPIRYALGAVMVFRRADLDAVGGFESMADHLADDNRLGHQIVGLGRHTHLCPLVVDCRVAPAGWRSVWRHQLRWAITIRVCQPVPYFLSLLANGTLWPMLWAAADPAHVPRSMAAALVLFRIVQGLSLESRFTGTPRDWGRWWLAPFKDLAQVALWFSAFLRHHVVWRGARYRVTSDGRLHPAPRHPLVVRPPATPPTPATLPSSGFGIPPRTK